ncbi:beta-ribofuranosylaminobenzene 5'-phosphate synthase family [Methanohalobium evestigatum Z-7303]|uniref:Beta-ribofuranosylaminobenzene 5'-phosphate synthase n=1 Tax=Methanohalobium evestigatum (strain ATCC BAA-1072 / DSM 3721 / NBRC 107634 / OCM 161 / Z-7303) TaxID=644295 RepID=D7EAN3_METEZ|nr:beta-ribofuranosylaminobenzene 5'-phosphate synthase [Methanohalobium evestigatum]ADI75032.1 beta-ribofuranosylaminobenzene 5'-phosphate synthase family [Methanohalobium evestigatum Z-7303]
MIRITSPSRLHLSLIDLNAEIGRVDGGLGITLDYPKMELTAEKSDNITVTGNSALNERVKNAVKSVLPDGKGINLNIEDDIPPHVGLGSGTQSALSAASAVNEVYNLGLDVRELAEKVGRGGTSGIGVASFESGGFLVDAGHKFNKKEGFSPSAASKADPAPIVFRHDFPDWDIIMALPHGQGAHDAKEVDIFNKECPIPLNEVQEISHLILMQIIPAILENDIDTFGRGINHLQSTGFKKREIALQSEDIKNLIRFMNDTGAKGCGMSSFGPDVFGFSDSKLQSKKIREDVQSMLDDTVGGHAIITSANNTGANISEV